MGTTAQSEATLREYLAGLGNPLPGKWDECTLNAGQTPIGVGVINESLRRAHSVAIVPTTRPVGRIAGKRQMCPDPVIFGFG